MTVVGTIDITWGDVQDEVDRIVRAWGQTSLDGVWGVPRGGMIPAAMVAQGLGVPILDRPTDRTLVIDDLIDSGATAERIAPTYFDALYRKSHSPEVVDITTRDGWLVFPWEKDTPDAAGPADAVVRLLQHIGEDPTRDGLVDTPGRVLRALAEMTSGYKADVGALLTRTFAETGYAGLVVVRGVDFVSMCEHHMLTFTGTATVGYIPAGKHVVGLSKLARLVDVFAARLQVQERMTEQIADAIEKHVHVQGVGVIIKARHSCLACRGARKANAEMITSSLRGALYADARARAEFMSLD